MKEALETPWKPMRFKVIKFRGRVQTPKAWGKELGISNVVIISRLHIGWSVKDALTRPVVKRGTGTATHCPHGHEFNDANTYKYRGSRQCRTCVRLRKRKAYQEAHP